MREEVVHVFLTGQCAVGESVQESDRSAEPVYVVRRSRDFLPERIAQDILGNGRLEAGFAAIGGPHEADRGYAAHDVGIGVSRAEPPPGDHCQRGVREVLVIPHGFPAELTRQPGGLGGVAHQECAQRRFRQLCHASLRAEAMNASRAEPSRCSSAISSASSTRMGVPDVPAAQVADIALAERGEDDPFGHEPGSRDAPGIDASGHYVQLHRPSPG